MEWCNKTLYTRFLVVTLGNIQELWEVKPRFRMQNPIEANKLKVLNDFVSSHNINGAWINEDNLLAFEKPIQCTLWLTEKS